MGELASGVAHEIRNPLNTIGTIAQQLDKDFEPAQNGEEYHQLAGLVHSEVKRIDKTVREFLRFARPTPINPQPFLLSDLLTQLEKQYQSLFQGKNLTFHTDLRWDGEVCWDRQQIQQALMNLIQNGVDALPSPGKLTLTVEQISPSLLELGIRDNGPGIEENIQDKIFNLYFTTKSDGTGIGLSLVQQIVDIHGGAITVDSKKGQGPRFVIHLPLRVRPTSHGKGATL